MKLVLAILALCAATTSFAADVSFRVSGFRSERKFGNYLVTVYLKDDGTAGVVYDPNSCDPSGEACTRMAVQRWEGPIQVIGDHRPTDGPLLLQLGPRYTLVVGSGFNIERKVHYTLIVLDDPRDQDGPAKRVQLTPEVFADVR